MARHCPNFLTQIKPMWPPLRSLTHQISLIFVHSRLDILFNIQYSNVQCWPFHQSAASIHFAKAVPKAFPIRLVSQDLELHILVFSICSTRH